jgi:flagellar export protein FliJ
MPFRFPLAAILRVREIIEEREEAKLQKILFDISRMLKDLERTDAQLVETDASRQADLLKPCIGLQVHASYGGVKELNHHGKELAAQIQQLEQLRDGQVIVYDAARRDREMLTDMRDKKRTAYDSDISKREQKVLDDNYIARRGRR